MVSNKVGQVHAVFTRLLYPRFLCSLSTLFYSFLSFFTSVHLFFLSKCLSVLGNGVFRETAHWATYLYECEQDRLVANYLLFLCNPFISVPTFFLLVLFRSSDFLIQTPTPSLSVPLFSYHFPIVRPITSNLEFGWYIISKPTGKTNQTSFVYSKLKPAGRFPHFPQASAKNFFSMDKPNV